MAGRFRFAPDATSVGMSFSKYALPPDGRAIVEDMTRYLAHRDRVLEDYLTALSDLVAAGGGGGGSYTDEQVRDVMGATLVAGSNTSITVNDTLDTITIASGGGAGSVAYRHVQATASTTWTVVHSLLFYPAVTAVDSSGRAIIPGTVDYGTPATVILTFSAAVAGEAYCT